MKSIDIIRYGSNGEGVGIDNKKVVFVPYSLCGEKVCVDIIGDNTQLENGEIIEIEKKSDKRVNPICPYYKVCGGCDIMHASESEQKVIKQQIVTNNLKKYADYNGTIEEIIASDKQLYYRNHITFQVNDKGQLCFYEKESHNCLKISKCYLANDIINQCITIFNSYFFDNFLKGYDNKTKTGEIKNVDIKFVDSKLLITIVTTIKNLPNLDNLIVRLNCLKIKYGVFLSYNDKNSTIYGQLKHLTGIKEIEYIDNEIKSFISPFSFIQINENIKDKIYSKIFNIINGENVIDAYCGRGVLSCQVAKKVNNVIGIDIVESSISDAENLAIINKIKNVSFICGDVKDVLYNIVSVDTIILDPPRKGCDKQVLECILKKLPKQIIYLSCASNTLARDLKILQQKYKIKFIQPYDMFPQTRHIETLVELEKM